MIDAFIYIVVGAMVGQIALVIAFGFSQLIRRWA